jgi:hypothetical protein
MIMNSSVSLHLHHEEEHAWDGNKLIELPLNPFLGRRDPNFRLLRAMENAAQAEIERQGEDAV